MRILSAVLLLLSAQSHAIDFSSSRTNYEKSITAVGGLVYVDRDYTFTSLPDELTGVDFLKTANSDKTLIEGFQVAVLSAAKYYVGYDSRFLGVPSWLSSWNVEPFTVGVSGKPEITLIIYSQSIAQGGDIELGGYSGYRPNMYTFFITSPLSPPPPTRQVTVSWDHAGSPDGYKLHVVRLSTGEISIIDTGSTAKFYVYNADHDSYCFSVSAYLNTVVSARTVEQCAVVDGSANLTSMIVSPVQTPGNHKTLR